MAILAIAFKEPLLSFNLGVDERPIEIKSFTPGEKITTKDGLEYFIFGIIPVGDTVGHITLKELSVVVNKRPEVKAAMAYRSIDDIRGNDIPHGVCFETLTAIMASEHERA